ncbi:hypothetical protein ACC691_41055, partial [Rhizobium johnstonii]|uniref:hypothetical protein n=1 Tax=Rhizobium johnstonii TaxID=3019933 RepID=UPI003F9C7E93
LREHAATIDLAGIADSHPSPLVVIDPANAQARADELAEHLPFASAHFAVTALPHPAIVQALWGRTGFALSNVRELALLE